jgi:hypothetical protein
MVMVGRPKLQPVQGTFPLECIYILDIEDKLDGDLTDFDVFGCLVQHQNCAAIGWPKLDNPIIGIMLGYETKMALIEGACRLCVLYVKHYAIE